MSDENTLIIRGKINLKKMQFPTQAKLSLFEQFLQNDILFCVLINKQLKIFQGCFGVPARLCQGKG